MPRYHFNVYDGKPEIDLEGRYLSGLEEARHECVRVAAGLLAREAEGKALAEDWRVETTDGRGMILFRVDVTMVLAPAVMAG